MALEFLIFCACGLAKFFACRLNYARDTAVLGVFALVATVPLGIAAYLLASYGTSAALLVFAIPGLFSLYYISRMGDKSKVKDEEKTDYALYALLAVPIFTLLLAYFYLPLPIVENSGNTAWLGLIKNYGFHGTIYFDANSPESGAPHLGYALYSLSNLINAPAFPSLIFAGITLFLLYVLAQNFTGKSYSFIAVAAFACSPMFLSFATAPAFYPLFSAYLLASLLALLLAAKHKNPLFLLCAGVLCGGACGVYYGAYLYLLAITLLLALYTRDSKATLTFTGSAFVFAAPWLLRNFYFIGNPVYPYFQALFPNNTLPGPYLAYVGLNPELEGKSILEAALHLIQTPWHMVMQPQNVETWRTNPGVFLVAFIIPAFAFGNTRTRLLAVFAALVGGVAYIFNDDLLTLSPYVALLCIPAVASLSRFPHKMRQAILLCALLMIFSGLLMQLGLVYQKRDVLLGRITKDEYLSQRIAHYPVYDKLNKSYNDGATVLLLEPGAWYLDMPAIYNPWVINMLANKSEAEQRAWIKGNNVKYIVVSENVINNLSAERLLAGWVKKMKIFKLSEKLEYPAADGARAIGVEIYTTRQ